MRGCTSTSRLTQACVIDDRRSQGGAIYNDALGTIRISGSTLQHNIAATDGGAIFDISNTPLVLFNNTFQSNSVSGGSGGAIQANAFRKSVDVVSCTFLSNSAGLGGGAISATGVAELYVRNSTFAANVAHSGSGGAIMARRLANTLDISWSTVILECEARDLIPALVFECVCVCGRRLRGGSETRDPPISLYKPQRKLNSRNAPTIAQQFPSTVSAKCRLQELGWRRPCFQHSSVFTLRHFFFVIPKLLCHLWRSICANRESWRRESGWDPHHRQLGHVW